MGGLEPFKQGAFLGGSLTLRYFWGVGTKGFSCPVGLSSTNLQGLSRNRWGCELGSVLWQDQGERNKRNVQEILCFMNTKCSDSAPALVTRARTQGMVGAEV